MYVFKSNSLLEDSQSVWLVKFSIPVFFLCFDLRAAGIVQFDVPRNPSLFIALWLSFMGLGTFFLGRNDLTHFHCPPEGFWGLFLKCDSLWLTCVEDLTKVFWNLGRSKGYFAPRICVPLESREWLRDKFRGFLQSPVLLAVQASSEKYSVWIFWYCMSKRSFKENIWPNTTVMDGPSFLPFPLSPDFLLSAWEPLQRIRCVGTRRHAVIVKRIWKYNWKQTLLSKADLGEFLLWERSGFQVFPLFGADVSEHLFCEMNHLWILHLGVIYWEMSFFLNVEETQKLKVTV